MDMFVYEGADGLLPFAVTFRIEGRWEAGEPWWLAEGDLCHCCGIR